MCHLRICTRIRLGGMTESQAGQGKHEFSTKFNRCLRSGIGHQEQWRTFHSDRGNEDRSVWNSPEKQETRLTGRVSQLFPILDPGLRAGLLSLRARSRRLFLPRGIAFRSVLIPQPVARLCSLNVKGWRNVTSALQEHDEHECHEKMMHQQDGGDEGEHALALPG